MTKSAKTTSPTRSRDKVLQTLYELELGGEELKEVLKNHSSEKSNKFYKEILKGCLLYTSPSPRDLSTSRMPSSA